MEIRRACLAGLFLLALPRGAQSADSGILKRWDKGPGEAPSLGPTPSGPLPEAWAGQKVLLGHLEVALLEGGFVRGAGGLVPKVRLLFKNADPKRRFHKNIKVNFFGGAEGKRLSSSQTFINLKPGQTLERGYAKLQGPAWASLDLAPDISVEIRDKALSSGPMPLRKEMLLP